MFQEDQTQHLKRWWNSSSSFNAGPNIKICHIHNLWTVVVKTSSIAIFIACSLINNNQLRCNTSHGFQKCIKQPHMTQSFCLIALQHQIIHFASGDSHLQRYKNHAMLVLHVESKEKITKVSIVFLFLLNGSIKIWASDFINTLWAQWQFCKSIFKNPTFSKIPAPTRRYLYACDVPLLALLHVNDVSFALQVTFLLDLMNCCMLGVTGACVWSSSKPCHSVLTVLSPLDNKHSPTPTPSDSFLILLPLATRCIFFSPRKPFAQKKRLYKTTPSTTMCYPTWTENPTWWA